MGSLPGRHRGRGRGDLSGQGLSAVHGTAGGSHLPDRRRDRRDRPGHGPAVPGRRGAGRRHAAGPTPRPTTPATACNRLGPAWAFAADVTDPASVESAFLAALDRFGGRLDVLVHVAGISGRRFGDGPLHECTPRAGTPCSPPTRGGRSSRTRRRSARCSATARSRRDCAGRS